MNVEYTGTNSCLRTNSLCSTMNTESLDTFSSFNSKNRTYTKLHETKDITEVTLDFNGRYYFFENFSLQLDALLKEFSKYKEDKSIVEKVDLSNNYLDNNILIMLKECLNYFGNTVKIIDLSKNSIIKKSKGFLLSNSTKTINKSNNFKIKRDINNVDENENNDEIQLIPMNCLYNNGMFNISSKNIDNKSILLSKKTINSNYNIYENELELTKFNYVFSSNISKYTNFPLKELYLQSNNINDILFSQLIKILKKTYYLEILNLSKNNLTDNSLEELAEFILESNFLIDIDISYNTSITNIGINILCNKIFEIDRKLSLNICKTIKCQKYFNELSILMKLKPNLSIKFNENDDYFD